MIDNNGPLVSVICLCYNHKDFLEEAIESVLAQDYPNVELLVVDDASSDGSSEFIEKVCAEKGIKYLLNSNNSGNCASFNKAFQLVSGEFIIDFAADDIMMPQRISKGVKDLLEKGLDFGVHFSDAMIIDEQGMELGLHTILTRTIDPNEKMPEGDVFAQVLERYFICPPTIMARREVFEYMNGYDESLSFEDFDFLVRASRKYKFCYSPEVLIKRRIVKGSKSSLQYRNGSKDLWSVLAVCKKALSLVESKREKNALNTRLQYECRQVIIHNDPKLVEGYLNLMEKNGMSRFSRVLYRITSQIYPMVFR